MRQSRAVAFSVSSAFRSRRHRVDLLAVVLLSGSLGLASVAAAQNSAEFLNNLDGSTNLEQRTGGFVETVCRNFGTPSGSRQEQLLATCTDLVVTGGNATGAGAPNLLGLDDAGLNDALRDVAHDEISGLGTDATELVKTQISNVSNRLVALRDGVTGISLVGLELDGQMLDGSELNALLQEASASGQGLGPRIGLFLNGSANFSELDNSDEEAGFDSDAYGVTAGIDYRLREDLVAGFAFGYTDTDQDYKRSAGDTQIDAYTGSVYATWFSESFYLDGIFSYTYHDYSTKRRIVYGNTGLAVVTNARGDTHGNEYTASLGGGYEFQRDGWSFGPRLRFDFTHLDIDGFSETERSAGLALRYEDQDLDSFASVLGAQVAYSISTSFGVITPELRMDWEHEYDNDSRNLTARFVNDPNQRKLFVRRDSPDRDVANLGFSVAATLAGGLAAFVDYEIMLFHKDLDDQVVTAGIRWEF